jgi:hypothetical protein
MSRIEPSKTFVRRNLRRQAIIIAVMVASALSYGIDNSAIRVIATVVGAVSVVLFFRSLYLQSLENGLYAPKHLKKYQGVIDTSKVVENWVIHKGFHDHLVAAGVNEFIALEWISAFNDSKMRFTDQSTFAPVIIRLDKSGLSPETFVQMYKLGVDTVDQLVTIGENDIDRELVKQIFPLVTDIDRRIRIMYHPKKVLEDV